MFKKIYGVEEGAEIVQVTVDELTGCVDCFLFISDEIAEMMLNGFVEIDGTDEIMERIN